MNLFKLFLLGPFQVTLAGKPLDHFETNKTRALLAYLAAETDLPQSRDVLAGLFWAGYSNEAAFRNLRLTLFRLRQTIDQVVEATGVPSGTDCLLFPDRQSIQINYSAAWTDLAEFESLLEQCSFHEHANPVECTECAEKLIQAVSLYRGEFLEGFFLKDSPEFEEWILIQREHLHQRMLEALDQLVNYFLWVSEHAALLEERRQALNKTRFYTQRLLQMEPWRESAHRQHMKALAMSGQIQEALAQYQLCCQMISEEFGIDPDPLTVQLYQQIRERSLNILPDFPDNHLGQRPPNNLISQLTPLIGRQAQLARLERLLFSYRWVTLVGEGGVGKTRLALAAAEKVLARFPDGVWLISLAERGLGENWAIQNGEIYAFLAKIIAGELCFEIQPDLDPLQQLIEYTRSKKMLLIFDSFEHLSRGADMIMDLLTGAPNINILVTTRQVLNFQAGYIMRVEGLPVPDAEDDQDGGEFESVQLFAERAERLSGSFRLDEQRLPVVIHICKQLDGIPLAIELAAPWATRLPLEDIARAIQTDLDFLSTSMAGIPERHRSMRAVFESSWRLLTSREQWILSLCASLPGEFSLAEVHAAAQAVVPTEIESLVDKFLLLRVAPGRYRLHEILRQYALEKLPSINTPLMVVDSI